MIPASSQPSTNPEKLKAYIVSNDNDDMAQIVFAKSNAQARRIGSDGEWEGWSCRREQWADAFYPGPVPLQAAIDHGWWTECVGCGCRIENGTYDADDNELEFHDCQGTLNGPSYCCSDCKAHHIESLKKQKALGEQILEIIKDHVRKKIGPVDFNPTNHPYFITSHPAGYIVKDAIVHFSFPGQTLSDATARIHFDYGKIGPANIQFYVCQKDEKAFVDFVEKRKQEIKDNIKTKSK